MATLKQGKQLRSANILLVDDEPNILTALHFLMVQKGYRVITAKSGAEALQVLKSFQPDVVVLDVMMPDIDGFQVAKTIRNSPVMDHTHIIFLTAIGTKDARQKSYKVGGEMYLTKPFDNDEFVESVAYALEF